MSSKPSLLSYNTLVHAVAGATGSVVGMTVFYPLDTVRSRLQLEEGREAKNTLSMILELVEEEGFNTLYRGAVPVLKSICASNFVYFYTFHGLKNKFSSGSQSALRDLLLASVAGVVNVLITTPLWVANTRLKMAGVGSKASDNEKAETGINSKGLIETMIKIARTEGIEKLWSGTGPSLILVSNPAIHFMVYEFLKRHVLKGKSASQVSALTFFLVGAAAKAIATILTYPLQLVQTKMRHGHSYPDLEPSAGTVKMFLYIIRYVTHYQIQYPKTVNLACMSQVIWEIQDKAFYKQGPLGIYKGMEAKILQTVLTAALMFMTYEQITRTVMKLLLASQQPSRCRI